MVDNNSSWSRLTELTTPLAPFEINSFTSPPTPAQNALITRTLNAVKNNQDIILQNQSKINDAIHVILLSILLLGQSGRALVVSSDFELLEQVRNLNSQLNRRAPLTLSPAVTPAGPCVHCLHLPSTTLQDTYHDYTAALFINITQLTLPPVLLTTARSVRHLLVAAAPALDSLRRLPQHRLPAASTTTTDYFACSAATDPVATTVSLLPALLAVAEAAEGAGDRVEVSVLVDSPATAAAVEAEMAAAQQAAKSASLESKIQEILANNLRIMEKQIFTAATSMGLPPDTASKIALTHTQPLHKATSQPSDRFLLPHSLFLSPPPYTIYIRSLPPQPRTPSARQVIVYCDPLARFIDPSVSLAWQCTRGGAYEAAIPGVCRYPIRSNPILIFPHRRHPPSLSCRPVGCGLVGWQEPGYAGPSSVRSNK